jgi:hypothetical protein
MLSTNKCCNASILEMLFHANETSLILQPLQRNALPLQVLVMAVQHLRVSVWIRGQVTYWFQPPASNSVMAVCRICGTFQHSILGKSINISTDTDPRLVLMCFFVFQVMHFYMTTSLSNSALLLNQVNYTVCTTQLQEQLILHYEMLYYKISYSWSHVVWTV